MFLSFLYEEMRPIKGEHLFNVALVANNTASEIGTGTASSIAIVSPPTEAPRKAWVDTEGNEGHCRSMGGNRVNKDDAQHVGAMDCTSAKARKALLRFCRELKAELNHFEAEYLVR
jgi:hypothetical protein